MSTGWQAAEKGLDAVNALACGCAVYIDVLKLSRGSEFAAYQLFSTD